MLPLLRGDASPSATLAAPMTRTAYEGLLKFGRVGATLLAPLLAVAQVLTVDQMTCAQAPKKDARGLLAEPGLSTRAARRPVQTPGPNEVGAMFRDRVRLRCVLQQC